MTVLAHRRVLTAAALALALAGCGSSGSATNGSPGAPTPPAPPSGSSPTALGGCSFEANPRDTGDRKPGLPPTSTVLRTGTATVTLVTNLGTIVFTADQAKVACTVASFRWLAGKHYYDSAPCHRLTTSGIFVLQCGDPTGTGTGGPGYTLPEEALAGATYPKGSVAMAKTSAPHSTGSQFFLNYDASPLPPQYTPVGTITAGLDVLQRVAKAGEDDSNGPGDGKPDLAITLTSVTVSP